MEALDLDRVADHFTAGADDMDDDDVDDGVEPILVCDGVSVGAFNQYVGDGEGFPIGVCFLQLEADGHLLIVEFPTPVHEATARCSKVLSSKRLEIAERLTRGAPSPPIALDFRARELTRR